MTDLLREEILQDLGMAYCPVMDGYVPEDCFNHCDECIAYIEFNKMIEEQGEEKN